MKMRLVTELRGKYAGQPIWISGSDPTLDGFPNGFERGKTMIVLNTAYFKFSEATYTYSEEHSVVIRLLSECPKYGRRPHIFPWPLRWSGGDDTAKTKVLLPRLPNVHWGRLKPYPPRGNRNDILGKVGWDGMKMAVRQAKAGDPSRFGSYGTCFHTCVLVAILMGGNPINVIGCGHKVFGKRLHFGKDGKREASGNYVTEWGPPKKVWKVGGGIQAHMENQWKYIRRGTAALIEGAAEVGITINRVADYERAESL